jgi:hypothetical protein
MLLTNGAAEQVLAHLLIVNPILIVVGGISMNRYIIGSAAAIVLVALAIITAGVSIVKADDFELEFMEFSIDKRASLNPSTGEAQIRGRVTCQESPYEPGEPADFGVTGELKQKVGREVITGSFSARLTCDTETRDWSATVIPNAGRFRPGRANVKAEGCASPPRFIFDCDQVATKVQLKKAKD